MDQPTIEPHDGWRRWHRRVFAGLLLSTLLVPATNVLIDPYDLVGLSPLGPGPTTNQRQQHLEAILREPGRFNVLLLGTSIMGINDPRYVDELLPSAHAYNAAMFMATAEDLHAFIQHILRRDGTPRLVIVGLDPFLLLKRPNPLSMEFRLPPVVSGQSAPAWWTDVLFASSAAHAFYKVADLMSETRSVAFDRERGGYSLPGPYRRMQQDPQGHARRLNAGAKGGSAVLDIDEAQFEHLSRLSETLRSASVTVLWIVQPPSKPLMDACGMQRYRRLIERMKERASGDVVDLSLAFGPAAADPAQWYDLKHYTAPLGREVLSMAIARSPAVRAAVAKTRSSAI